MKIMSILDCLEKYGAITFIKTILGAILKVITFQI